tara:strand:- start:231 stop:401 length:171 start_codon:yes stop_codon:yes gene_type:complete
MAAPYLEKQITELETRRAEYLISGNKVAAIQVGNTLKRLRAAIALEITLQKAGQAK